MYSKKSVHLSLARGELSAVLTAEPRGYRAPQFRFWAKKGDDFVLLKDWGPEQTYMVPFEGDSSVQYGVHIRSGDKGDLLEQAWVEETCPKRKPDNQE
jgi:hypothetical protein